MSKGDHGENENQTREYVHEESPKDRPSEMVEEMLKDDGLQQTDYTHDSTHQTFMSKGDNGQYYYQTGVHTYEELPKARSRTYYTYNSPMYSSYQPHLSYMSRGGTVQYENQTGAHAHVELPKERPSEMVGEMPQR